MIHVQNNSDSTYSAAKLREFVLGNVGTNEDLYHHTAIVEPGSNADRLLSYMESIYSPGTDDDLPARLRNTRAGSDLRRAAATSHVGRHVEDLPAYASGITDQAVEISAAGAFGQIQRSLVNNHAPYLSVMFGAPNAGKTTLAALYLELWLELAELKYGVDETVVVSNSETFPYVDHVCQSASKFVRLFFGSDEWFESNGNQGDAPEIHPDTPTFWIFDEASTHLDARTNSYQVAEQYTPYLKRFAKINTDAIHIGHSGYDIHAELRRDTLMTEFLFKRGKKTADVYASMNEDKGADLKYTLEDIPLSGRQPDPDDFAPWSWES